MPILQSSADPPLRKVLKASPDISQQQYTEMEDEYTPANQQAHPLYDLAIQYNEPGLLAIRTKKQHNKILDIHTKDSLDHDNKTELIISALKHIFQPGRIRRRPNGSNSHPSRVSKYKQEWSS